MSNNHPDRQHGLGFFADAEYRSVGTSLAQGDRLLLYSDGLSEAFNGSGQPYGVDRFAELLRRDATSSPRKLVTSVLEDVRRFRDGGPQTDDLTIMVLIRNEASAAASAP